MFKEVHTFHILDRNSPTHYLLISILNPAIQEVRKILNDVHLILTAPFHLATVKAPRLVYSIPSIADTLHGKIV